jgi:hypothetical protein
MVGIVLRNVGVVHCIGGREDLWCKVFPRDLHPRDNLDFTAGTAAVVVVAGQSFGEFLEGLFPQLRALFSIAKRHAGNGSRSTTNAHTSNAHTTVENAPIFTVQYYAHQRGQREHEGRAEAFEAPPPPPISTGGGAGAYRIVGSTSMPARDILSR